MDIVKKRHRETRDFYLSIICRNIDPSPEEIINYKGRKRTLLEPKQVLRYALYEYGGMSHYVVSELTGNKTHCNSLHTHRTVSNLLETDRAFRQKYWKALEVIEKETIHRCLIVGDMRNITEEQMAVFDEIKETLIKRAKYPVLIIQANGEEQPDMFRRRIDALLQCGSIYVMPGYEDIEEAVMEHDIAMKLGIEIIYG